MAWCSQMIMREKSKKISLEIKALEKDLASRDEKKRWKAAADLSDYVEKHPSKLWPLVVKYGSSGNEDLRMAVATCILEHVLQYHFGQYFPKLEKLLLAGNRNLRDTFSSCWKHGQSESKKNSKRWEELLDKTGTQREKAVRKIYRRVTNTSRRPV